MESAACIHAHSSLHIIAGNDSLGLSMIAFYIAVVVWLFLDRKGKQQMPEAILLVSLDFRTMRKRIHFLKIIKGVLLSWLLT